MAITVEDIMTTPQQAPPGQPVAIELEADGLPPLFDKGNALLATSVPMNLLTGKLPTPQGEIGIATIRTTTTTLTVTLDRKTAGEWAQIFAEMRDALSDSGLMVASGPALIR
jgi:hypothetical protein